ncbi:hypothetical protein [Nocardioides pantholopis]|uniref:hypothetical protein n=1 Tax=Nocardioides pantholopis TaxID=2483798 RepID=UPI000FD9C7BD|nr:hypothetical protein [Nocardioides pantholopis]
MELLAILVLQLFLTALPMVAGAGLAALRGVRAAPVLIAVALAAGAALAMMTFWAYFVSPSVGKVFSFSAVAGSAIGLGLAVRRPEVRRALITALTVPFALWALGSAFLVLLGFAHGGLATPIATATNRFTHLLPSDSEIPYFYVNAYDQGFDGRPPEFPGEWLSSDRPHLQTGYLLGHRVLEWGNPELSYQVGGVVLQQLWILGLWALLVACVGRTTRALVMAAALLSDLAITNGFFVWPKLLPTALLLALAALVATKLLPRVRADWRGAALAAALASLAMMGHGSSVFGILALILVAVVRGWPSWRWLAVGAAVAALVMVPWTLYQQEVDPPGNRLPKWQLAGQVDVDDRSTGETVIDSYSKAGPEGVLDQKLANFEIMLGRGVDWYTPDPDAGKFENIVKERRAIAWYALVPSAGLLLLGPLALLLGWRRSRDRPDDRTLALTSFGIALIGAAFCGLLLWGPPAAMTTIHVGSMLVPMLLLCGSVAALRAVAPRFAVAWVVLYALVQLVLYLPSFDPPAGTHYSPPVLLAAAASLAAYVGVLVAAARPPLRSRGGRLGRPAAARAGRHRHVAVDG